jgi:hypothetical protein
MTQALCSTCGGKQGSGSAHVVIALSPGELRLEHRHDEDTDTRNFSLVTLSLLSRLLTRSLLLRRVAGCCIRP